MTANAIQTPLAQLNQQLIASHQTLAKAIKQQVGYNHLTVKHFTYTTTTANTNSYINGIERNVYIWLKSIDSHTPANTHTDYDRVQIALHFTLPDAKKMLESCISTHGSNWISLKEQFIAVSLPEPYDSLDLIDKIRNIKRHPDEPLQSIVLRLEDLGERLSLDKSYTNLVQPILSDSFAQFLPKKFHRSLTVEDKKSLKKVLEKALIFQINNPETISQTPKCQNKIKVLKSHPKTSTSHSHQNDFQNRKRKQSKTSKFPQNKGIHQPQKKKKKYQNSNSYLFQPFTNNSQKSVAFIQSQQSFKTKGTHYNNMKQSNYNHRKTNSFNNHANFSSNNKQGSNFRNRHSYQNPSLFQRNATANFGNWRRKSPSTNLHFPPSPSRRYSFGNLVDQVAHVLTVVGCIVVQQLTTLLASANSNYAYNY